MATPNLLLFIAVARICISVLGEKATQGKPIFPVFRRAAELSIVFYAALTAMHFKSLGLGIMGVVVIVYYAARSQWDDMFRRGFRRLVRNVFRRNAPSNPQI